MCLFSIILLLVCALANDTACQKDFENCAFQIARHLLINHGIFQQNNDLCLYSQEKKIGQFVWKIRCGKIGVEISTNDNLRFLGSLQNCANLHSSLAKVNSNLKKNLKKKNVSIFQLCVLNDFVTFLNEPKTETKHYQSMSSVLVTFFQKLNQMSKETPSIIHENFIRLW